MEVCEGKCAGVIPEVEMVEEKGEVCGTGFGEIGISVMPASFVFTTAL